MAKGEPPLRHLPPLKVIMAMMKNPAPTLDPTFSEDFQDFISCCLKKDPTEVAVSVDVSLISNRDLVSKS